MKQLLVLLVACASQPPLVANPSTDETSDVDETNVEPTGADDERSAETASVTAALDPLPEIGEAPRVEWPERFLGRPVVDIIADSTLRHREQSTVPTASLMQLYRDDGHRAFELHLIPIDDRSGWVIDRGVVTSPDYTHSLYERWSRIELRGREIEILAQVGRSEAGEAPRSSEHEARYDAIHAHHDRCVAECDDLRCRRQCSMLASRQLATPHVLTLGDARVTIHAPTIRIEWGEHVLALDIDEINVVDHPTRPAPFFARIRREQLDRARDAIVISYGHGCDEDAFCPSSRVFIRESGRIRELEGEHATASDVQLRGDATVRFNGGALRMCEPTQRQRARHRASVELDDYDPDHFWWHQRREIRRGVRVAADGSVSPLPDRAQPWGECTASFAAACPYVDIVTAEGTTRVGEILRWIRGEPATQGLALGRTASSHLVVRLSEEKPETTYLDAVWLEVEGERIDPLECAGLHCAADGRAHVMREGDSLTLGFRVPVGVDARLVATGHYVVDAY